MKALYFSAHGSTEQLSYGELPDPVCHKGHAVIRVKACALNHLDLWVLKGWPGLKLQMPHIGGSDIAGEIVELGDTDTAWKVGQKVVVNPGYNLAADEWTARGEDSVSPSYRIIGEDVPGGFAEYAVVPIANLYPLLKKQTFEKAAALALVGLTSWRMLVTRGKLTSGQTVLIVGSGGGVNSTSAVFAKALGARVIVLASGRKLSQAQSLGADTVIDYDATPEWHKEVLKLTEDRGVDIVVDNVGARTFKNSMRAVRRGGKILTVGNTSGPTFEIDNRYIFSKQISLIGSTMGSRQDFEQMLAFVSTHKIAPIIDSVSPLSEGRLAYERLANGAQFGKIVLVPQ